MVIRCAVRWCKTVGTSGFHSFPTNQSNSETWVRATESLKNSILVDRLKNKKLARSFIKICSKHFKESDYIINSNGQKRLRKGVFPPLMLPDALRVKMEHNYSKVKRCCVFKKKNSYKYLVSRVNDIGYNNHANQCYINRRPNRWTSRCESRWRN